jgi:hypothetical protein
MDTNKIIEKIKSDFLINSAEHGEAYSNGDYKKANKLHKKLHDLYNLVKEHEKLEIFNESLNNENENVRFWSAIFTLKFNSEIAEKILEELSINSNIKMTAKTTLHLWKEGKLDLL